MSPIDARDDDPRSDPAVPGPLAGGLGEVKFLSDRLRTHFGDSQLEAANNLLTKARRSLRRGDDERAETFVAKALKLPFNEHDEIVPAAWDAYMELYMLVTDLLDVDDVDDDWWLSIVIPVFEAADEPARHALCNVLRSIVFDYELLRADARRIQKAIAEMPDRDGLPGLGLSDAQLQAEVMSILRVHRRIEVGADMVIG